MKDANGKYVYKLHRDEWRCSRVVCPPPTAGDSHYAFLLISAKKAMPIRRAGEPYSVILTQLKNGHTSIYKHVVASNLLDSSLGLAWINSLIG